MASSTDSTCNEHDYSTRFEVPLEAIKQDIIQEEYEETQENECQTIQQSSTQEEEEVTRIPVVLRDNKPKLRRKKPVPILPASPILKPALTSSQPVVVPVQKTVVTPSKQTVLLPRPIMPKIGLPPLKLPNSKGEPPPNYKGVLVVQDVKFCTMYVPKNDGLSETVVSHSFPVSALSKSLGVPTSLIPASAPASLISAQISHQPTHIAPALDKNTLKEVLPKQGSCESLPIHPSPVGMLSKSNIVPLNPSGIVSAVALPTKICTKTANTTVSIIPEVLNSPRDLNRELNRELNTPLVRMPNSCSESNKSSHSSLSRDVQNMLCGMLPIYWFSSAMKEGIDVMLLSIGKEKAIQRRIYVTYDGKVEISVHCKLLPEHFARTLVEMSGTSVHLTNATVKPFCEWIVRLVQVVRDLQICTGSEHPDNNKDIYSQASDIYFDYNPYQECRFTEAWRSRECLRLVAPGCRRCTECSKSFCKARKNRMLSSPLTPKKKSSDEDEESSNADSVGNTDSSDMTKVGGKSKLDESLTDESDNPIKKKRGRGFKLDKKIRNRKKNLS